MHHAVTQQHRSREFVTFLEKLDACYPAALLICILLDNPLCPPLRAETRRFLASKPGRFELVFATHASWLNYVEPSSQRWPDPCCGAFASQQGGVGRPDPPLYRDLQRRTEVPPALATTVSLRTAKLEPPNRVGNSRTQY